jgi:hypothetical protein
MGGRLTFAQRARSCTTGRNACLIEETLHSGLGAVGERKKRPETILGSRRGGTGGEPSMSPFAIERHFPTFVICYRWVLALIRLICRVGIRLLPRVAVVVVMIMTCVLAWIVVAPDDAGRVRVPATIEQQTLVGFSHRGPAPWPRGNCFTIAPRARWTWPPGARRNPGWRVCNMHAENFSEVVKRLGLQTVEVLPLEGSCSLITDQRIPREWLLEKPCSHCFRGPVGEELRARYPDRFRAPAKP